MTYDRTEIKIENGIILQTLLSFTCWTYKVQTDVNATIMTCRQRPFNFQLFLQIRFKLRIDVINNRLERIVLIDLIAVSNRIANGQLQADTFLLQLIRVRFELNIGQCMRTRLGLKACIE